MRTIAPAALAFAIVLAPAAARAYDMPYDPYVVRRLRRRRGRRLQLRIPHHRAMPSDGERHRRLLRAEPVLQPEAGSRALPQPQLPLTRFTGFWNAPSASAGVRRTNIVGDNEERRL